MKYVCPHCNQAVTCKWWESKTKLQCKHCSKFVFESVKQKLSFVSFISALLGILSIYVFMEVVKLSLLIRLPLLILTLIILGLFISTIEKIICRDIPSSK